MTWPPGKWGTNLAIGGGSRTHARCARGTVSPPHRSTKVLTIGGGSREIMYDLAARQMGY